MYVCLLIHVAVVTAKHYTFWFGFDLQYFYIPRKIILFSLKIKNDEKLDQLKEIKIKRKHSFKKRKTKNKKDQTDR
jgi:hypothetical protein